MNYALFKTVKEEGVVFANSHGICRVLLPPVCKSQFFEDADREDQPSEFCFTVADMLTRYFKGEQQAFENIAVDLSGLSTFRICVLNLVRGIGFGEIVTYQQVAEMVGSPGAARAVGGALAANPVPIIIPCHRIVASNGKLTGFTAPGGVTLKKYLLEMEGIDFRRDVARPIIDSYKQKKLA